MPIVGATAADYAIQAADHGQRLSVQVTAVNPEGATVAAAAPTENILTVPYVAADGSACGMRFLCPTSEGAGPSNVNEADVVCGTLTTLVCQVIDELKDPGVWVQDPNDCYGEVDVCRILSDGPVLVENPNDCKGDIDVCTVVGLIYDKASQCLQGACDVGVPTFTCDNDQACGAVDTVRLILESCADQAPATDGSPSTRDASTAANCADADLLVDTGNQIIISASMTAGDASAAAEDTGITTQVAGIPSVTSEPLVQQTNSHAVIGGPSAVLSYYESKAGVPARQTLGDDPDAEAAASGGQCTAAEPSGSKRKDFEAEYGVVDEDEGVKGGRTFIFKRFWYRKYSKLRRQDGSVLNVGLLVGCSRGRAYPANHRGLRHAFTGSQSYLIMEQPTLTASIPG